MYMVKMSVLLAVLIGSGFLPAGRSIEAMAKPKENREFTVKYHVQNDDLYIETYTPSIHFSENESGHRQGEGHLHVVIDNRQPVDVYKAAFIIKNLPEGKHTVRIQLAKNNHQLYGEEEVVDVEIQS